MLLLEGYYELNKRVHEKKEKSSIKVVVVVVSKIEAAHEVDTEFALDGRRSNDMFSDFEQEGVSVSPNKENKVPIPISTIAVDEAVA